MRGSWGSPLSVSVGSPKRVPGGPSVDLRGPGGGPEGASVDGGDLGGSTVNVGNPERVPGAPSMDLGGHRGVSEEDSVDEGQQPVGDALAQPPPGPPKAAPLPPLLHNCSELPECSSHQEQQQGRGQAWGGTGGVKIGRAHV